MVAEVMRGWLDEAWSQTEFVRIVAGGEDGGDLDHREVLAELRNAESLNVLRSLTTTGRFTGDICRCHGGQTIVLLDSSERVTASASVHGFGSVSWDRPAFRNDLDVLDPAGLHLFLARQGVPHQLTLFLAPLTALLDLHESRPQFRPAGKRGRRYLAERHVPDVLHPLLLKSTGQETAALSGAQVEDIHRTLTEAVSAPEERAAILLSWLGRLPVPAEAFWGEGVLVRLLLARLSRTDVVTAAARTNSSHIAMGIINLTMHSDEHTNLGEAISPTLQRLLPPQ
jgi:hypothetical protein